MSHHANFLDKTRVYNNIDRSQFDRPWENPRTPSATSTPQSHQMQSHQQPLPPISDLCAGIPRGSSGDSPSFTSGSSIRDSGNWSMQSPSKHASVISTGSNGLPNGLHLPSISADRNSPNRNSAASGPDDRSPFSPSLSSRQNPVSPGGSSLPPRSNLPQLNQAFENGTRNSGSDYPPSQESRRSSIDSRMNQGMNSLALSQSSPYNSTNHSANPSQVSLVSRLQGERGIPTEVRNGSIRSAFSPSHAPRKAQSILGMNTASDMAARRPGRIAPPIDPKPRSEWPNPHAETPTKGFPYAFPDPDMAAPRSSAGDDDRAPSMSGVSSHQFSRRGSFGGTSVTSSVFTNDSHLPPGQRRLDEAIPSPLDTEGANHHHHQLQHKQLSALIDDEDDPDSPNGSTPYSRTPELRVSHKLAERKRRSEMKGLFEDLRSRLPADGRVSKTSKWEVLMKAIEYIKTLESQCDTYNRTAVHYHKELEQMHDLRRENMALRSEMAELNQRLQSFASQGRFDGQQQQQQRPPIPTTAPPPAPPPSQQHQQQQRAEQGSAMQGVQYGS